MEIIIEKKRESCACESGPKVPYPPDQSLITSTVELVFSQVSKVLFREQRGFSSIWITLLPSGNWAQGVPWELKSEIPTIELWSGHNGLLRVGRRSWRRGLDHGPSLTIQTHSSIHLPPLSLPILPFHPVRERQVKFQLIPLGTQTILDSFEISTCAPSVALKNLEVSL